MSKTVTLKVTSAFLVGGKIARVGEIVDVAYADAKDLLHRGKAVLAVVDAAEAGETQPAEAETQEAESETEAAEAETQPAKGKGKKAK